MDVWVDCVGCVVVTPKAEDFHSVFMMDPNLKKGVKRRGLPLNGNDLMLCQGENAKLMTKEEDLGNVQPVFHCFYGF